MKITPTLNAVWGYAEWCCDNRRAWPKLSVVARDLNRNKREVERAFEQLVGWGILSVRMAGHGQVKILRLGDGRETVFFTPAIHKLHINHDNSGRATLHAGRRKAVA